MCLDKQQSEPPCLQPIIPSSRALLYLCMKGDTAASVDSNNMRPSAWAHREQKYRTVRLGELMRARTRTRVHVALRILSMYVQSEGSALNYCHFSFHLLDGSMFNSGSISSNMSQPQAQGRRQEALGGSSH